MAEDGKKRVPISQTPKPMAEIGLEEYILRSQALLSDASVSLELIADVEEKRKELRMEIETAREEFLKKSLRKARRSRAEAFVKSIDDPVHDLKNLNTMNVSLADQAYNAYDQAITEIDQRIRCLNEHVKPAVEDSQAEKQPEITSRRRTRRENTEPRYCFCNGVAYGDMIACDNPDCLIEWFHFHCLDPHGFTPPVGTWFCPLCRTSHQ